MTDIEITITQTIHCHGMTMDTALSHVVKNYTGPNQPMRVEISARYVDHDDDGDE